MSVHVQTLHKSQAWKHSQLVAPNWSAEHSTRPSRGVYACIPLCTALQTQLLQLLNDSIQPLRVVYVAKLFSSAQ